MRNLLNFWVLAAAVGGLAVVATPAHAELVYGLNDTGTNLFSFNSATPGTLLAGHAVTGLTANEQLLGIDFRPADGNLYGIGSFGNLYRLNGTTAQASLIGNSGSPNGVNFGFDFNPSVDRARLVSEVGSNVRIDPNTGGLAATDTNLAYAAGDANFGKAPNVVDLGYSNNVPGAPTTTLYGIDSSLNTLVSFLGSPNGGQLVTVGALGLDVTAVGGLDISPSGVAFAVLQTTNSSISNLYTINLTTGAASLVGQIDGGLQVRDLAVVVPEPVSVGLLGMAIPALLIRRRRKA